MSEFRQEFMGRCRWLVENMASVRVSGDWVIREFVSDVVHVCWEYHVPEKPCGPDYRVPSMVVSDGRSGAALGAYIGQGGGTYLSESEAEPYVKRLRQLMLLDELAQSI